MKTAVGKAVLIALTGSVAALASFVAQADVPCRTEVGFATTPSPFPGPTGTGAWTVVDQNGAAFLSRNKVSSCSVKVVTAMDKGKPVQGEYLAPAGFAESMTADECSMYKYLSSVDSKLSQGKNGDALTIINSMIAKIGTIQITDAGRAAIGEAAYAVQFCIISLP